VSPLNAGAASGNTGNSGGAAKTLYVHVQAGQSTARQAIAAVNAEGTFAAALDPRDSTTQAQAGFGLVDLGAAATTTGGAGINFDKTSGIRVVNGGKTYDLSFDTAQTVEDLLNIINGSGAGMVAQINADATGIDIRSRLSGADFSIGELGGATATQLGVRTFTGDVELDQLNHGRGVITVEGVDFTIVSNDGAEIPIDLGDAKTVGDVLDAINNSPDNAGRVTARLAVYGGGIELVDDNPAAGGALAVKLAPSCWAAEQLGLVPVGEDQSAPPTPAEPPVAVAALTAPNTDLTFTANQAGTALGGVQIQFAGTAVGDQATVSYDEATRTLTIGIDPTATRAETVVAAVNAEGTFAAALNTDRGPNDGQGVITDVGVVATASPGAPEILTGRDVNPEETHGVFNSLIRLKQALAENDPLEVQRSLELLDEDIDRVNFGRAEIGARQQSLDAVQARLDNEHIELKAALSQEIDVDFAKVISDLTARQFSLQASLRTTASLLQQTLLNYL
jgi:flagellar hook-associated protein 3 FlgL